MGLFGKKKRDIDKMEELRDIQGLNKCLKESRGWYAARALGRLAEIDVVDASSVPLLNQLLSDPDKFVRGYAAGTIGNLAEKNVVDAYSIQLLNPLLKDYEKEVRWRAAEALGSLAKNGYVDASSIPLLNNLLKDNDNGVRNIAQKTLKKMESLVPILNTQLTDSNARVRANANSSNQNFNINHNHAKTGVDDDKILEQVVMLYVPEFMDTGTSADIIANLRNDSNKTIENISIDFSDLENFFSVEGEVNIPVLRPGMAMKRSIRIRTKHQNEEGVFVVKIIIMADGSSIERDYTIKVGGTEIY
jgi:hypothetical protein